MDAAASSSEATTSTPVPEEVELDRSTDIEGLDRGRPTPYRFNESVEIWQCASPGAPTSATKRIDDTWQFRVDAQTPLYIQFTFFAFTSGVIPPELDSTLGPWCMRRRDAENAVVEARVQGMQVGLGALVVPIRVRPGWGNTRTRQIDTDVSLSLSLSAYQEAGRNARIDVGALVFAGLAPIEIEYTPAGATDTDEVTRIAFTSGVGLFARKGPLSVAILAGVDILFRGDTEEGRAWDYNRSPWFGLSVGLSGDIIEGQNGN